MDKKRSQLGMNPSTASGRLLKDLLYQFVIAAGHVCFRCGEQLTRETFSVEHIVAWLDSETPVELFFNIDNIAYSHLACNVGAARRPHKIYASRADAKKVQWERYYAKKSEQILERKRARYNNQQP